MAAEKQGATQKEKVVAEAQAEQVVETKETTKAEQVADSKPVSYPIEYLAENAAAFETLPEVVIGALVGKETATKEEAQKAIEAYLKTPNKGHKEAEEGAAN